MEGSTSRVDVATLAQIGQELDLVSVEVTGKVQLLAAHHSDLAALQQVLGDHGGQTAQQMAATINNNGLQKKSRLLKQNPVCEVMLAGSA